MTTQGGQLNFGVNPQQAQEQLRKAAAANHPNFASSPLGQVLHFVSHPAYAVGSALSGHPLEAVRHLAQVLPVVQVAEHIPGGVGSTARSALEPHEDVLPAEAPIVRRAISAIPNRYARAGVGLAVNVAGDPLSYVTFGAGGVARGAVGEAARLAVKETGEAVATALGREGMSTAERLAEVGRTRAAHTEAQQALRTARGPGVRVGFRVPLTRGKVAGEVGVRVPQRVASPVGRAAERVGATRPVVGALARATVRGGTDRVGYEVWRGIRRAASSEKQVVTRQAKDFHNRFMETAGRLTKEGALDESGKPLTVETAYRSLAHHLDNPMTEPLVHGALKPFAEEARQILDRYHASEREAGITYKAVETYIPHVLPKQAERERFTQQFKGRPSGVNPFFVHAREVKTLRGLEIAGYTPETNVARLLEMRGHASLDTLAHQQTYRVLAERGGIRAPNRAGVDVGGKFLEYDVAKGRLSELKQIRPVVAQRQAVTSARQNIAAAQAGAKAAGRQPYFAAQMRATRNLVQTRQLRDVTRGAARTGEGTVPTVGGPVEVASVEHGRDLLTQARRDVERARKRVVAARRLKDPIARREANQQLLRAVQTHVDARIALAHAKDRVVGTPSQIQAATRDVLTKQRAFATAERQQSRIVAENQRLATLPGRVANPQEWDRIHREWHELPGQWMKGVRVSPETHAVVNRMRDEIAQAMRRPEDINAFVRFSQQLTGRWKSLALLSPGFHLRNVQGDAILAWWAGARSPVSFVQSARLLRAGRGTLGTITIRGRTYTRDEFLQLARSQGVIGQGQAGAEIRSAQEGLAGTRFGRSGFRRALPKSLPGTGVAARASQVVGQAREDAMRMGTFIERLKAGDDVITAGNKVHEFHFDYADLSPFLRQARQFWLPFVTFTAKAAPLTVKQLGRNPGFFSHYARATEASNQTAGNPNLDTLGVGSRLSFGVPDSFGGLHAALGAPGDQPLLYNPERVLPFGTVNQLDPTQIQRQVISQLLTPFAKVPIELATDHRFYRAGAAPARDYAPYPIVGLHNLGVPIPGYGPKKDPLTGQPVPGYASNLSELLSLSPQFTQAAGFSAVDEDTARRRALSFLAGLPLTPYDRARALALAAKYGNR